MGHEIKGTKMTDGQSEACRANPPRAWPLPNDASCGELAVDATFWQQLVTRCDSEPQRLSDIRYKLTHGLPISVDDMRHVWWCLTDERLGIR